MALKLDNNLLEELGLGKLPDAEKQLLLRQIYEKLEMNVGMRLADQMSNEQLDAFEKFVEANDDKGAFQWLETNFPNYKLVVNEEFEKLKAEIRSVAPQILASAEQNPMPQQELSQPTGTQQQGGYGPQQGQQQPPAGAQPQYHQSQPYGPPPAHGSSATPPQQQYAPQAEQPAQPQPMQPAQPTYQPQQFASAPPASSDNNQTPPQPFQQSNGAVQQNGHLQPQYGGGPNMQQQHDSGSPQAAQNSSEQPKQS